LRQRRGASAEPNSFALMVRVNQQYTSRFTARWVVATTISTSWF
jgi:hypothetical protein